MHDPYNKANLNAPDSQALPRIPSRPASLDDVTSHVSWDHPAPVLPELSSPKGLAKYLDVPLSTLYKWRYRGEGPPGIKIGGHVRYRRADVEQWLAAHEEGRK